MTPIDSNPNDPTPQETDPTIDSQFIQAESLEDYDDDEDNDEDDDEDE